MISCVPMFQICVNRPAGAGTAARAARAATSSTAANHGSTFPGFFFISFFSFSMMYFSRFLSI